MEYESNKSADSVQFNLRGEFTFVDNDVFQSMVRESVDSRVKNITLNFVGLEFIDSAALSMLLVLRENCAGRGQKIGIINAAGRVKAVLEEMKFSKFIPMGK